MAQFRKKPVVIEAMQYTGASSSEADVEAFVGRPLELRNMDGVLCPVIPTLEGEHIASPGDWIIRGIKGEHYPCKPEIFAVTYEAVDV